MELVLLSFLFDPIRKEDILLQNVKIFVYVHLAYLLCQGSQPNTPVRLVTRQEDQQQTVRKNKEAEELKRKVEKTAAVDSRQRVKELLEEVAKQNTVISQVGD